MANYDPAYEYKNNPHYIQFTKDKEELKKKYPAEIFDLTPQSGKSSKQLVEHKKNYIQNQQQLHRQYLKELADLIFEPNGSFQQLTWDLMAEVDKLEMERKARGKKKSKYEY